MNKKIGESYRKMSLFEDWLLARQGGRGWGGVCQPVAAAPQ